MVDVELSMSMEAAVGFIILEANGPCSARFLTGVRVGVPLPLDRLPFLSGDLPAGEFLLWSCLAASSPTVACLRSSINVHKPSLRSPTNCLPVLTRSSLVPFDCR